METKVNYQRLLDEITNKLESEGRAASLLLHSCCGPCSSYVVTYLKQWFDITVLYYNPNIYPEEEYDHRLSEQARLLEELGVPLIAVPYDHQEFLDRVQGLESEPEGGRRCAACFELRLEKALQVAKEGGFSYFATTLTVSPHKNAVVINRIGEELAAAEKTDNNPMEEAEDSRENISFVKWLPSDFKKRDGYKQSIELSKKYNLYRQDYCGCEFAMGHLLS